MPVINSKWGVPVDTRCLSAAQALVKGGLAEGADMTSQHHDNARHDTGSLQVSMTHLIAERRV